jgi:hypothetical protein
VKDNKTWRVAEVLDVKEHDLHFRFLGWAEVRSLWQRLNSLLIVILIHSRNGTS